MGIITLNFSRKHRQQTPPGTRRMWTFSEGGLLPHEDGQTSNSAEMSQHRHASSDIELLIHDEEGRVASDKKPNSNGQKRHTVSSPSIASSPKKRPNPLDISTAEGVDDLNEEEFNLCSNLRILPTVYFHAKHTLMDNARVRGFYKKSAAQKMLRIDVNKTGKLYDYFYSKGWLPQSADYQP